jgi:hypothetical protein
MSIVINDFEAVAAAPAPAVPREAAAEEPARPDPAALAAALRELAEQAARVWAH